MLTTLEVPSWFARNHASITEAGALDTGEYLINTAMKAAGLNSLKDSRILDLGCGTRFSSVLINRNIPVHYYMGIDVFHPVVRWLRKHVERHDERFAYKRWDVVNALYNEDGKSFSETSKLPLKHGDHYDLIWMFSVITHQYPEETLALFKILREHCSDDGSMFFTAFIHEHTEKFLDAVPERPLMEASFNDNYMRELLKEAGWKVDKTLPPHDQNWHQHCLLCSKA
jgi:SAM-dependent methyltransferase